MKIFISYAHEDKEQVGPIKQKMESEYGLDVFLAHEDIEPSSEWQDVIVSELKICGAILLFLSPNFNESEWTDQETGYALAREIRIIPVNAGVLPHGFVGRYQAHRFVDVNSLCEEVFNVFIGDDRLKEEALDELIRAFGDSDSFTAANSNTKRIMKYEDRFNSRQKNEIVKLAGQNTQIVDGYVAMPLIRDFAKKNERILDPEIFERFIVQTSR